MKKQGNDIEKKQVCKKCGVKKNLSEFYRDKTYKKGFKSKCKLCLSDEGKTYYKNHKTEHKDRMKKFHIDKPKYSVEYYDKNPHKLEDKKLKDRQSSKKYYHENKLSKLEKSKKYYYNNCKNNPLYWEKRKDYSKDKYSNNIEFRLQLIVRSRIYQGIKNFNYKKKNSNIEELGCYIKSYIVYLEQQFDENMNWGNYGIYWEIDHTIPISKGGGFHYTNTTPMEITENRKKSNK